MSRLAELQLATVKWLEARNITEEENLSGQYQKLLEEAGELGKALIDDDINETKDAIGDMLVVLTGIAFIKGMSLETCLHHAYQQIKDRKGKMVNGVFVKEQ